MTMISRLTGRCSITWGRCLEVSSTNMRTEIAEYYHLDPDNGLTMNLVTEYGLRGCSWLSAKVDDHGLFCIFGLRRGIQNLK